MAACLWGRAGKIKKHEKSEKKESNCNKLHQIIECKQ